MRILTLSNAPLDERLGSGKSVVRFSKELERLGNEVRLYGPGEFECLPGFNRATKLKQGWGAYRFIKNITKTYVPDIVELYGDEFWLALKWLKNLKNRPLIVAHTNGLELLDWEKRKEYEPDSNQGLRGYFNRNVHQRLSKFFFQSVDRLVCLCEADRNYVVSKGIVKLEDSQVVNPGLDDHFLNYKVVASPQNRIAFTGSWITRKGVSVVVEVIKKLMSNSSDLHFDIFGSNKEKQIIYNQFPFEHKERIHIHGSLDEMELIQRLSLCKIFIFPSYYEGFGMALTEAMACGCCVVTSATGYGAEIKDGIDGFVVENHDIGLFYDKISNLLKDDSLRATISNNAKKRVKDLKWRASGDKLDSIYKSWLAEFR